MVPAVVSATRSGRVARAARTERVVIERADILRRDPAHIHPSHERFEVSRPSPQPVNDRRPKRVIRPAQLRHGELQRAGLCLHVFRFVVVAPAHALAIARIPTPLCFYRKFRTSPRWRLALRTVLHGDGQPKATPPADLDVDRRGRSSDDVGAAVLRAIESDLDEAGFDAHVEAPCAPLYVTLGGPGMAPGQCFAPDTGECHAPRSVGGVERSRGMVRTESGSIPRGSSNCRLRAPIPTATVCLRGARARRGAES
jgi:hypothetical protein